MQGDAAELNALSALAARNGRGGLPTSSHKGAVGHLLQASGFVGVATAAQVLRTGTVPPNPRLEQPEPVERVILPLACLVPDHRPRWSLVNGFGFGGNNACVALLRTSNS